MADFFAAVLANAAVLLFERLVKHVVGALFAVGSRPAHAV